MVWLEQGTVPFSHALRSRGPCWSGEHTKNHCAGRSTSHSFSFPVTHGPPCSQLFPETRVLRNREWGWAGGEPVHSALHSPQLFSGKSCISLGLF